MDEGSFHSNVTEGRECLYVDAYLVEMVGWKPCFFVLYTRQLRVSPPVPAL